MNDKSIPQVWSLAILDQFKKSIIQSQIEARSKQIQIRLEESQMFYDAMKNAGDHNERQRFQNLCVSAWRESIDEFEKICQLQQEAVNK